MTRAKVEAKQVPNLERVRAYKITGDNAAAVQFEIKELMNAQGVASAEFCNPIRDGKQFLSVGTIVSYEREEA